MGEWDQSRRLNSHPSGVLWRPPPAGKRGCAGLKKLKKHVIFEIRPMILQISGIMLMTERFWNLIYRGRW
jgi:hypothetical protein